MRNLIVLVTAALVSSWGISADTAATRMKIEQALGGDNRSGAEVARDANRKPAEVLEFFELEDDMKVLEISPATGYWSKFVGPTLCANGGELLVSVSVSDDYKNSVMSLSGMDCVSAINDAISLRELPEFSFEEDNFDLVLTFWNLHNPSPEGRENLNKAVFQALKPGGVYGVVDHTRRHMQPTSRPVGRRLDPVLVVKELLDVGFELADYSDMHYHPEEGLDQEVGTPSVRGATDRFTMKFRKPD